jgi:hypothetical protein
LSASDAQAPDTGRARSPSGSLDVSSLLTSSEVTIRPQEDPADAAMRRFKDRVRFLIAWGVVLVVGAVALHLTLSDHASPDRAAWGRTVLAALVSALGGYAIGKSEKR